MHKTILWLTLVFSTICSAGWAEEKIAIVGDSMMAWNRGQDKSVGNFLEDSLDVSVRDFSRSSARITHPRPTGAMLGLDISKQLKDGDWSAILVNGFANDLFFECGCRKCSDDVDRLIGADGKTGEIPRLLTRLKRKAPKVYFLGYHRPRNMNTPIKKCGDEVDLVESRIQKFTKRSKGIEFVSLEDVFPPGDTSFYAFDRVHPSKKGSEAIADRLIPILR